MSVQDEINRINQNVADTYSALGDMGASLPEIQNSNNMANTVRTIPQSGDGGSASSFRVTATASLTSQTGGILTEVSRTFSEIETANAEGKCVVLDIDISQINLGQRAALPLISYINNAVALFGGSINTAMTGCMQMSAMLDAEGNALIFVTQLATSEDLAGLGGGDNSFKVTADYVPSVGADGIIVTVSKLSATFADIKAAFDLGKDIKFVARQTIGNTNDKMLFTLTTINDTQICFSATAFLGTGFMLVGYAINADNTTSCLVKTI